jgi:hypothetical protein
VGDVVVQDVIVLHVYVSTAELVPGGAKKPLSFANRSEFIELATALRLHEFDAAVAAMRRGLLSLVPEQALRWFTWREMEVLVSSSNRSLCYQSIGGSFPSVEIAWGVSFVVCVCCWSMPAVHAVEVRRDKL